MIEVNPKTILTCAVTGGGDTVGKHPAIPVTPEQIADACFEAAEAGAAIVHIHVRDPETGKNVFRVGLFEEVMGHLRRRNFPALINLTAGNGGTYAYADAHPRTADEGSDLVPAAERVRHVALLEPDICTVDCGTMNETDRIIYIATKDILREMLGIVTAHRVMPEIEVFDIGQLELAKSLINAGAVPGPYLLQFCLGIGTNAPADLRVLSLMKALLPPGAKWASFGIGRQEFPMVAASVISGGHARVGLEDNLYLRRGVFASNGQLVARAVRIIEDLGSAVATVEEARTILGLQR